VSHPLIWLKKLEEEFFDEASKKRSDFTTDSILEISPGAGFDIERINLYRLFTYKDSSRVGSNQTPWTRIVSAAQIEPNRFLSQITRYAQNVGSKTPIDSGFLDTIPENHTSNAHQYLFARASSECLPYGGISLVDWFAFFATVCLPNDSILKCIASIVKKYPLPYVASNCETVLKSVDGFYNMPNIIECLLNGLMLKCKQHTLDITLKSKLFHINEVIDEVTQVVAISPKIRTKLLRPTFQFIANSAGLFNTDKSVHICNHSGWGPHSERIPRKLERVLVDNVQIPFADTRVNKEHKELMNDLFTRFKMKKTADFANALLEAEIGNTENSARDFTIAASLFLDLPTLSGYGRSLRCMTAAVSATDPVKKAEEFKQVFISILLNIHNLAKENDFHPIRQEDWISKCIGNWKTTGSGMPPVHVLVTKPSGQQEVMRTTMKVATGMIMNQEVFSRAAMERKLTIDNPGHVGSRDVPVKASRAVFPIAMPTNHAQMPLTEHMQAYISTAGKRGRSIMDIDASHFMVGASDTMGIRTVDDADVIALSGSTIYYALDMDMSEFDSHCIFENFRDPIMEGLRQIYSLYPEVQFNGMSYLDLIELGYGEGHVHKTFWDVGRRPILFSLSKIQDVQQEEVVFPPPLIKGEKSKPFYESKAWEFESAKRKRSSNKRSEPTQYAYSQLPGAYMLGVYNSKLKADLSKPVFVYPNDGPLAMDLLNSGKLYVGFRMDGKDATFLTSEASGEYSTLFFNTIANLAIQEFVIKLIKMKYDNIFRVVRKKALGDDIQIVLQKVGLSLTTEIIDNFLADIQEEVGSLGHLLSINKCFFRPWKAEFRQTHSLFGLMIPRDHIMYISSERKRILREPDNYLKSRHRVLLTKVSRGISNAFAILIFLFDVYMISRVNLRSMVINMSESLKVRSNMPNNLKGLGLKERNAALRAGFLNPYAIRRTSFTTIKDDSQYRMRNKQVLVRSILTAIAPMSANGFGLSTLVIPLIVTPAIYYRFYILRDQTIQHRLLYSFFLNACQTFLIPINFEDDSKDFRMSYSDSSFSFLYQNMYSLETRTLIENAGEKISIGRVGAKSNVRRMLSKCVQNFASVQRQNYESGTLFIISQLTSMKMVSSVSISPMLDEWVLGMSPMVTATSYSSVDNSGECPIFSLDKTFYILTEIFGMKLVSASRFINRDMFRSLIAREPALANVIAPEEIFKTLQEHGAIDNIDRTIPIFILRLMGFTERNSQAIYTFIQQNGACLFGEESLGGGWTDDTFGSMNIISDEFIKNNIFLPVNVSPRDIGIIYSCANFAAYLRLEKFLFEAKVVKKINYLSLIDGSKQLKKALRLKPDRIPSLGEIPDAMTIAVTLPILSSIFLRSKPKGFSLEAATEILSLAR
jgi:hypothetical protein